MDLDSLISLFFIFIFFVLPAILNRRKKQAKKEKKPEIPARSRSVKAQKKKPSILDQISLKIQQTIQELEEQARKESAKGKTAGQKPAADLEKSHTMRMDPTSAPKTGPLIPPDEELEEKAARRQRARVQERRKSQSEMPPQRPIACRRPWKYGMVARPGLQQVVIWSEILGRPVGLRQGPSSGPGHYSI